MICIRRKIMTGKQLIVLGLLICGIYIYFSFKQISQELSTVNTQNTLIKILNSEEKNNIQTPIETAESTKIPMSINIEEKIIKVIKVVKETPIQQESIKKENSKVEEEVIETLIKTQSTNSLESEIETALKGISTSKSIDK